MEEMKAVMGMLSEQAEPAHCLREGLHAAAFGETTPMGQTHACPPLLLPHLGRDALVEYQVVVNSRMAKDDLRRRRPKAL